MILSISGSFSLRRKLPPQLQKVMKLTAIFLTVVFLQVHAKSVSQVTLSLKNASVEKVFNQIERQTGLGFIYTKAMLAGLPQVTIKVKDAPVKEVLDECFKDQSLEYIIDNNTIVITRKVASPVTQLLSFFDPPPPVEIRGRVVNQQGEPLENVTILISGTKLGTTTNADGRFTITVPDNNKKIALEFSSVGFETKKVDVGKQTEVNVVMEQNVAGLDDVVVVGYTTQRKVTLTGAVSVN